jgi:hypothetical protein
VKAPGFDAPSLKSRASGHEPQKPPHLLSPPLRPRGAVVGIAPQALDVIHPDPPRLADRARSERHDDAAAGAPAERRGGDWYTTARVRVFPEKQGAANSYPAPLRVRVLGRPMGSSAFIFASAASTIPICELWRRSNRRRTEFSGTQSCLASLVLDQPRLRIVS